MIIRIILNLVMLQSILTRVNMADIKTVSETLVGEKQDVFINTKGPLNLLRGYIGNRSGYMHNKRFYSSEIDTDYSLTKREVSIMFGQEYDFTRTPVNDRVYKDLNTKTPEGKYLSTYHMQLIKMFPSADGSLSIEAGRPNMITNFLRAEHVKKDAKYILAALLLLSEGVDIKIDVDHTGEKKKLVIKSKTCEEKVFVNVEMYTAGIDPVTNKYSENIYQSEAAEIVKFYIRCRDNPLLKKGGKFAMPATKEEFESGKFLNSAAFLIQTYIYEFIDTVESYVSFVNAVHELLVDQVAEKENPEQTKKKSKSSKIFDELFLAKKELSKNINYNTSFYDLMEFIGTDAKFPFHDSSELPQYTRVPRCKLDKSGFERDQFLYYSDCVETALLGLFCCLAYNPETGKYETSHMGEGVSDELRDFFKKYPKPTETTDFEMHMQWCKVLACLENDKVDYREKKNELLSGVANILLAISEITGQKKEIIELVEYIEDVCKAEKLDDTQKYYISSKIESIIKSLSLNKTVEVECSRMKLEKRSNDMPDIFSEINIIYPFDQSHNGISLDIRQGHANLTLLLSLENNSEQIKEKREEVKKIYNEAECYIGYIVSQKIDVEDKNSKDNYNNLVGDIDKSIDLMLQEASESVSKIFLLGKISSVYIKSSIMECFIINSIDKEVATTSPVTRFTANILGSVPLVDPISRYMVIRFFLILARWQECYPRFGYKPSEYPPENDTVWNNMASLQLYTTLLSMQPSVTKKAMCNYIITAMHSKNLAYSAMSFIASKSFFIHITPYETVDNLVEIQSTLKEYMKGFALNDIYISWFTNVCTSGEFSPEFIKKIYSFISFDGFSERHMVETSIFKAKFKQCLNVLEEKKTLLCSVDDSKSIENYDALVSYLKEFNTENKL
ncbi:hypothetical protein NEAUS06_0549 [Nematocida ausubeli]|nr:hypothetical protein NEAUS06_0549 [Nematocida ausubeli]